MDNIRADELDFENLFDVLGLAPELPAQREPRETKEPPRESRRLQEIRPGYLVNPETGKEVKSAGRVGKRLIAENEAALIKEGVALPRGVVGRTRGLNAFPTGRVQKFEQIGRPKPTGAFRAQIYQRVGGPALTVADFARDIARTIEGTRNYRQTHIALEDDEGARIWRTIHGKTAAELTKSIDKIQLKGALGGSGEVPAVYTLVTSDFHIGFIEMPAGGAVKFTGISKSAGTKHPHLVLMEFAGKSKGGDCLLAVLRAVAKAQGLQVPKERNAAVRTALGIPEGPIAADPATLKGLADLFGLHVRVVTGLCVPPDAEREFDDNAARLFGRNTCFKPEASPQVLAEARSARPDAPEETCDVYLSEGHYQYVSKYLAPVICEITGDIIEADDSRTQLEIVRRVTEQGRSWYGKDRHPADAAEVKAYREMIIVFDYETFYRADGTLEPYALGYTIVDPEVDTDDFSGDEAAAACKLIIRREGQKRFEVSAPLLDELARAPPDVRYTLVSFNGARFDHFLLAQASNNRGTLSSVFATAGGGLRSMKIGRHTTLDLAKLCPAMSLDQCCEGFKTSPTKEKGFSHYVVQRAAEEGRLYEWLTENRGALAGYLTRDILSEASLFMKLNAALPRLTGQAIYGAKSCQTIGGHAWEAMKRKVALPKPVAAQELDKTIRAAIVGGRVQCYTEESHIEEKCLYMVDFASLYPTAMAAVPKAASVFDPAEKWGYYPSGAENGEPRHVTAWAQGDVGIYRVTVHEQPPGLPNVLPRRGETLEWGYRGSFETWATHIDLSLITRGGGRVTVHEGYVWPVTRLGLFEPFIKELAAAKDEQDELSRQGSPLFNPALRMCLKLLMNSSSGKCCQNNYDDTVELATGSAAQIAAERKMCQESPRTWIPLGGETCLIIGKKPSEKVYKRTAKPAILAVLIYAYSRALVWRTLCQYNVLYSDTDSGIFRPDDYKRLRAAFPQLDPTGRKKELGDLEDELKPHARASLMMLAPKDYAVFLFDSDAPDAKPNPKTSKLRIKGVNMRTDRLIKPDAVKELAALSIPEYTEEYHSVSVERSKPLADIATAYEFYKDRAAGVETHVLSSQLVRSFRDVDKPLELVQRFLIKML